MTGLYVLSNCLDHILDAVIKLHMMIGVEMRVSILKEFYEDVNKLSDYLNIILKTYRNIIPIL